MLAANRWTRLLLLALLVLALPGIAHAADPDDCVADANQLAADWIDDGLPQEEIDRLYQLEIAACLDDTGDPGIACIVGAANWDLIRIARLYLAQNLVGGEFIALSRDRGRKLRAALEDPNWTAGCVRGDADGDLVPDGLDRCPETKELVVTDFAGCPTGDPLPAAPDDEAVRELVGQMGYIFDRECDGAPAPTVPEPIKLGYNAPLRDEVALAVTRVSNQPPDCRVFFEFQLRLIDRVNPAVEPIDFTFVIFREWEDTDPGNPARQVFRVSASDPGQRLKLFDLWKYYGRAVWRVRAMNGNGLSSPWSPMRVQDEPSFGEP
jgi:hypothetical protein